MRYPGFIGPSYTSQSTIADGERTVNWYPERVESPNGKAEFVLYPTPGFALAVTLADAPVRGLFSQNGRTFAVAGTHLYELAADYTATERGSGLLNRENEPVTISSNGDGGHQLLITSNGTGYLYDLNSNVLSEVVAGASQGGFIDGFFIVLDPQTSTLRISDLEDGSTWDALRITQRNAGADRWAGMIVAHKEIWLFGTQTTDVFYNAGTAPVPFMPNPSVFLNNGIAAPFSVALLDGGPVWLGQSLEGGGIVYRANGYTPVRISTHAIEYAISTYSTITDARAWTYEEGGHLFYVLTFPTARATWVFDATVGAWHERGSWDGKQFIGLPVHGHTFAGGVHLVGSRATGGVYRQAIGLTADAA